MSGAVLLRTSDQDVTGSQVRFMFDFDAAFSREADSNIGNMFNLWKDSPRSLNGIRLAEPLLSRRDKIQLATHDFTVISTSTPNPFGFVIEKHAEPASFGSQFGKALGDIEWEMNRHSVVTEYLFAKEARQPVYDEIHQWWGGKHRHYSRLLLPIGNNHGEITKILVIVRKHNNNVVPLSSYLKKPLFG